MSILLTGHLGYVGNVMAEKLLEENFDVTGLDIGYYPQNFTEKKFSVKKNIQKDIRHVVVDDLKGYDAILHLAALSNDPLGEINPDLTNQINYLGTVRLAELAKKAGVKRFVFSSSCSNYGANDDLVNEDSNLVPQTAYAKSKVESEKDIIKLKDESFAPIILRNATVYGVSPSQRLDLVVNNLTCSAYTTESVKLLSDGTAWRPLLHVRDMAKAFISVLKADLQDVSGEIFNVGSNEENYTVREVAKLVENIIPNSKVEFAKGVVKDNRSYKVDFSKIKEKIGFKTDWTVEQGIKELYKILESKENFTENDFNDKAYYRVKFIKSLIEEKKLDSNLFFT